MNLSKPSVDIRVVEIVVRKPGTSAINHYWCVQKNGTLLGDDYAFEYEANARRCARAMIATALADV